MKKSIQEVNKFLKLLATTPEKVEYGEEGVIKVLNEQKVDTLIISGESGEEFVGNLKLVVIPKETRQGKMIEDLGGFAVISK